MPCARCNERQTDPARGASPWRRVVSGGEQLIVCPACQRRPDWERWTAGLDRCPGCGSIRLAKALGVLRCGECGLQCEPSAPPASGSRDLAAVVAADAVVPAASRPVPPASPAEEMGRGDRPDEPVPASPVGPRPDLAAEVEAALARVLGRRAAPPAQRKPNRSEARQRQR
jgi:ribosomal protein L37AE/L43A